MCSVYLKQFSNFFDIVCEKIFEINVFFCIRNFLFYQCRREYFPFSPLFVSHSLHLITYFQNKITGIQRFKRRRHKVKKSARFNGSFLIRSYKMQLPPPPPPPPILTLAKPSFHYSSVFIILEANAARSNIIK